MFKKSSMLKGINPPMATRIYTRYKIPDSRATTKEKEFGCEFIIADVYTIDADLSIRESKRVQALLVNPLIEQVGLPEKYDYAIEIGYLPGVTDNVGSTATEMIEHKTYYSQVFFLRNRKSSEALAKEDVMRIASALHNPLIQRATIKKFGQKLDVIVPRVILPRPHSAQEIDLAGSDEQLMKISSDRTLALDLQSMRVIRDHFKKLKRNPTDIELESLAQTWSEHCKHTIFADPLDDIKEGLYRHYIKAATEVIRNKKKVIGKDFCISVFTDNSGAIAFDDKYLVTHKVETHNTPSALDPFGGAITGIVGVNRDTIGFGLGAKPIANFYGFCLADPKNKTVLYRDAALTQPMLSARRIMDGVIAGINAGGNQSGIPTPQGFLYFNDRYRGKPLVFAGTVGLIPRSVHGKPSHIKQAVPGDYIVMVGGRVGADGIHGATFSSEGLHEGSPATAVQIGDPITQKKLSDTIVKEARDLGLYHSITDDGAGGLSSSVGEMARDIGCEVEVDKVPLKYSGLEPWQIWISESQERMTLAVPRSKWKKFLILMTRRGVEATVIGKFTNSGRCVVKYNRKKVMDLDMNFLHDGRPIKQQKSSTVQHGSLVTVEKMIHDKRSMINALRDPNNASTAFVSRQYDHTVQGTAVIGPLQGKGNINGSASVIAPVLGSKRGIVLTHALAPELTEQDPYGMAQIVIEQAICNAVTIGADPEYIALLDNFCWCSSNDPQRLWQLKEAVRGCYDTAVVYGTPFISGKDSMFNDFKGFDAHWKPIKISILPTLLISAIGVIPDVTKTVTEDVKSSGDLIYILKPETLNLKLYRTYYKAVQRNLIASAISVARGGVLVALAKTAIAGQLGINVKIGKNLKQGIIASVRPENKKTFERVIPQAKLIGKVTEQNIKVNGITISIKEATNAYHATFKNF